MINNLRERGCDLYGIEGCPTQESQIERMQKCWAGDKQVKAECETMDKVYSNKLDTQLRLKVETLELFDEFEEWNLL